MKHAEEIFSVPYAVNEVSYINPATQLTLAGTLTIPHGQGPFPAALLIAGMGPNERDYALFDTGHKLFAVLADYLTRAGFAVLRYDKRGVGKSAGVFDMQALTSHDLALDAQAGVDYLKTRAEINPRQIGLVGHSEGGLIASLLASQSADIAFAILLAAALANSNKDIIQHVAWQLQVDGATPEAIACDSAVRAQLIAIVKKEKDPTHAERKMRAVVERYFKELPESIKAELEKTGTSALSFAISTPRANETIAFMNSPWSRWYFAHDPVATFKRILVPVLAINGDLDFTANSALVLPIIEQGVAQASNKNYKTMSVPSIDHWLQKSKTGAFSEYGKAQETIAPEVLQVILDWLKNFSNSSG